METIMNKEQSKRLTNQKGRLTSKDSIKKLTTIAMLGAISFVLMIFSTPIWIAPSNYKLDISEVPVLIGSFAMGPLAGIVIELIKILLNLAYDGSDTMFIGEMSNFLMGCAIVVPSAVIYRYKKSKKSAIIGLAVGTLVLVVVASLLNAYVLLPIYAKAYKMPMEAIIGMGTKINSSIKDLKTFIMLAVAPFNLVKGMLASILTFALYKKISGIIKNFNNL